MYKKTFFQAKASDWSYYEEMFQEGDEDLMNSDSDDFEYEDTYTKKKNAKATKKPPKPKVRGHYLNVINMGLCGSNRTCTLPGFQKFTNFWCRVKGSLPPSTPSLTRKRYLPGKVLILAEPFLTIPFVYLQ